MSIFEQILAGHGLSSAKVRLKSDRLQGKKADTRRAVMKAFVKAVDAFGSIPSPEQGSEIARDLSFKLPTGFRDVIESVQIHTGMNFDDFLTLPSVALNTDGETLNAQEIALQQSSILADTAEAKDGPTVPGPMPNGVMPAPVTIFPGSVSTLITMGINPRSNSWMRETILGGNRSHDSVEESPSTLYEASDNADFDRLSLDSVSASTAAFWVEKFDLATMTFDGATGSLSVNPPRDQLHSEEPHRASAKLQKRTVRQPRA